MIVVVVAVLAVEPQSLVMRIIVDAEKQTTTPHPYTNHKKRYLQPRPNAMLYFSRTPHPTPGTHLDWGRSGCYLWGWGVVVCFSDVLVPL